MNLLYILVLKDNQPSGDDGGHQTSKVPPMIASAMQLWQVHLGVRTILILPQDDAEMFVSMFSTKLEQLLKTSPKEVKKGSPDSQDRIWEKESCLHLLRGRFS